MTKRSSLGVLVLLVLAGLLAGWLLRPETEAHPMAAPSDGPGASPEPAKTLPVVPPASTAIPDAAPTTAETAVPPSAAAESPAAPTAPTSPPPEITEGDVLVRVLDRDSGRPIEGALVEVRGTPLPGARRVRLPGGERYLTTDAHGTARFYSLREWAVSAKVLAVRSAERPDVWANWEGDVSGGLVELRLDQAAGQLEGEVVDDSGRPIAGATIEVPLKRAPLPSFELYDKFGDYQVTTTDEAGAFVLPTVRPSEEHGVRAWKKGVGWTLAYPVSVRRDRETSVKLVIILARKLRGTVSLATGESPDVARVSGLAIHDHEWNPERPLDEVRSLTGMVPVPVAKDGSFEMNLLDMPNWFLLVTHAPGYQPVVTKIDVAAYLRGGVDVAPRLEKPGRKVSGVAVDPSGKPVACHVLFQQVEDLHAVRVETDKDGKFECDSLGEWEYMVLGHPIDRDSDHGYAIRQLDAGTGPVALKLRFDR